MWKWRIKSEEPPCLCFPSKKIALPDSAILVSKAYHWKETLKMKISNLTYSMKLRHQMSLLGFLSLHTCEKALSKCGTLCVMTPLQKWCGEVDDDIEKLFEVTKPNYFEKFSSPLKLSQKKNLKPWFSKKRLSYLLDSAWNLHTGWLSIAESRCRLCSGKTLNLSGN